MVGDTVGNYRIQSKLGEGGMGEVYRGVHLFMGREAALKVLLPEQSRKRNGSDRFLAEARATARLRHPGIVEIFDCGQQGDRVFIAMELLQGETLRARLDREGGVLPVPSLLISVAAQVAAALQAAHGAGIVHRDLKPDNIFLVRTGEPGPAIKVLDFGIAKLIDAQSAAMTEKTKTGALLGTPAYMSPEQCVGSGAIDGRSDIYGLGCILFEALCGRPPFVESAFGALMLAHLSTPPPSIDSRVPGVPAALPALIERCLAKDPARRPQTMDEVCKELMAMGAWVPPELLAKSAFSSERPGLTPASPGAPVTIESVEHSTFTPAATVPVRVKEGAEQRGTRPRARRTVLLAGAGAIAAATWLGMRGVRSLTPSVPKLAPPPVPEITVEIPGLPPGAALTVDGHLAAAPLRLPRDGRPHRLEVTAPGYLARELSVDAHRDHTLSVQLTPAPATVPPSAADPAKPETGSPRPRRKRSSLFTDL